MPLVANVPAQLALEGAELRLDMRAMLKARNSHQYLPFDTRAAVSGLSMGEPVMLVPW